MPHHYCYLIRLRNKHSESVYNGYTNNPIRRLCEHQRALSTKQYRSGEWQLLRKFNREQAGAGALEMYAVISGFPTMVHALQCEWKIKYPRGRSGRGSRRRGTRGHAFSGPRGWLLGLIHILHLKRWTANTSDDNENHPLTLFLVPDMFVWINTLIEATTITIPSYVSVRLMTSLSSCMES